METNKMIIQELTSVQKRMIRKLTEWMENFSCNEDNRTDSLWFALDNGFDVHAIELMSGTGATDKYFDRIHATLVKSVGLEVWRDLEKQDIKSLCNWANIAVCDGCNSHHFYDPNDDIDDGCNDCLQGTVTVQEKRKA